MNKAELIEKMAKSTGLPKKDAESALKSFLEIVSKELEKGHDVQLIGFGTFTVGKRAAREGRNPATGETIKIAASKTPKFKPGKALKDQKIKSKFQKFLQFMEKNSNVLQKHPFLSINDNQKTLYLNW